MATLWLCLIATRNVRDAERSGVGDDHCVKKMDCQICIAFTPAQIQ